MNKKNFGRTCLAVLLFLGMAGFLGGNLAWATSLQIDAYIDGRSLLIIQGNTVQWHNLDFTVPGKHSGHNDPTKLATADSGGPIWSADWYPNWPSGTQGNVWSDTFTGLFPPLAAIDQTVTINSSTARYYVGIYQQPAAANGYELIIDFNDNPSGGSTWYAVNIEYVAAAVVPLPGTLILLGSTLCGLMALRRKIR